MHRQRDKRKITKNRITAWASRRKEVRHGGDTQRVRCVYIYPNTVMFTIYRVIKLLHNEYIYIYKKSLNPQTVN